MTLHISQQSSTIIPNNNEKKKRPHGVKKRPTHPKQFQQPNSHQYQISSLFFLSQGAEFEFTPTKRRLSTSQLTVFELL